MIQLSFVLGLIAYSASAWLSYDKSMQVDKLRYYAIGLLFSFIANASWLTVAAKSPTQNQTTLYGLYWDSMLTGIFLLIPILFFGVRFTGLQSLGVGMVILGIVLTKV
jgi:multidrug transporter EmrE-like cation transporter